MKLYKRRRDRKNIKKLKSSTNIKTGGDGEQ